MLLSFSILLITTALCSSPKSNEIDVIQRYDLPFSEFVNETHAYAEVDKEIFDNVTDEQMIIIRLKYGNNSEFDPETFTGFNQPDQFILKNKTETPAPTEQITRASNTTTSSSPLVFVFAIIMALTFLGLVVVALLYVRSERRRKIEAAEREVSDDSKKNGSSTEGSGSSAIEMDENGEAVQLDSKFGSTSVLISTKPQQHQPVKDNFIESVQAPPELPLAFYSGVNMQETAFPEKESPDSGHMRPNSQSASSTAALLSAPAENVGSYPWPTQASERDSSQESGKKKRKKKKKNAKEVMPSLEGDSIPLDVMALLDVNPSEPQPTIPDEQDPEFPPEEEGEKKKKKKKKKKKQAVQDEFADF